MITVYRVSETPVSMTTLTWAVRVLFGHATLVTILTVLIIWGEIATGSVNLTTAIAAPLVFFFFAAVYAGLAWALHQLRSWARGPAIVMELLLIPLGLIAVSGIPAIGIVIAATGLIGAGLLLAPSTRIALGLTDSSDR
jgi:hypothetical protein